VALKVWVNESSLTTLLTHIGHFEGGIESVRAVVSGTMYARIDELEYGFHQLWGHAGAL